MSDEPEDTPPHDVMVRLRLESVLGTGISQRAFAQLTGIPRSTIGDFIRGTHSASASTLARIEEELG